MYARVFTSAADARADHLGGLLVRPRMRCDRGARPSHRFLMRNSPPRGEISVPGAAFTHVLFARLESIAQDESEHGLRRAPSLRRPGAAAGAVGGLYVAGVR